MGSVLSASASSATCTASRPCSSHVRACPREKLPPTRMETPSFADSCSFAEDRAAASRTFSVLSFAWILTYNTSLCNSSFVGTARTSVASTAPSSRTRSCTFAMRLSGKESVSGCVRRMLTSVPSSESCNSGKPCKIRTFSHVRQNSAAVQFAILASKDSVNVGVVPGIILMRPPF